MAQRVKDRALPLQRLLLLLWCQFDPWPGNVHMPLAWPKKKNSKLKNIKEFQGRAYSLRLHVIK